MQARSKSVPPVGSGTLAKASSSGLAGLVAGWLFVAGSVTAGAVVAGVAVVVVAVVAAADAAVVAGAAGVATGSLTERARAARRCDQPP
mgnify:CR=1 FL=1